MLKISIFVKKYKNGLKIINYKNYKRKWTKEIELT